MGIFGNRAHHGHDVQNLKPPLLGFLDWLLTCNHHHWHAAQRGISSSCYEIGCAWAKRCQTYASFAGMSSVSGGHKACTLLMPREDKLDFLRARQAI